MKEWKKFLEYIDYYVYNEEEDKIIIIEGKKKDEASKLYQKAIEWEIEKVKEHLGNNILEEGAEERIKWLADMALDCVREMPEKDREYISKHTYGTEYHFSYAMYIRNKYHLHVSPKKDIFESADGLSGQVMDRIFSILNPYYDHTHTECLDFYNRMDVGILVELYGDTYTEVFEKVTDELTKSGSNLTSKEATKKLKNLLQEALGPDEFKNSFKNAYNYYNSEADKDEESEEYDFWKYKFCNRYAPAFPLQCSQIYILMKMKLIWNIELMFITSLEEVREYIDDNIGFKGEYTNYLAEVVWEVVNPINSGLWKGLSVTRLDYDKAGIEYNIINRLKEDYGIRTLGDLCDRTYEEIAEYPEIGSEVATKIEKRLHEMGLFLMPRQKRRQ